LCRTRERLLDQHPLSWEIRTHHRLDHYDRLRNGDRHLTELTRRGKEGRRRHEDRSDAAQNANSNPTLGKSGSCEIALRVAGAVV
jgi:hypothetical protein